MRRESVRYLCNRAPPVLRNAPLQCAPRPAAGNAAAQVPELSWLLHREDAPRRPKRLPRPLPVEQDEAVQQELLRRNDLAANVFLLLRHTGMRIGEAVDLSIDCLHSCGPDQWAILVPLGKLKTERMVPVDSFVCQIVQRLRFFRSFDPLPQDGRLIARTFAKDTLIRKLRDYLHEVCHAVGISGRIVPHRMRHYATFRTMLPRHTPDAICRRPGRSNVA
jgi:integrase